MGILPDSFRERREKRKEEWRNIGRNWKKAKEEFRAIPEKIRGDLEPKKKEYSSKQDYILTEVEQLNKELRKIRISQALWFLGTICGFIVFFPIGIGGLFVMIINALKMHKIIAQIKERKREVDIMEIDKKQGHGGLK